jgi:NADP-dependent 3-hydroxy acid dehydrogenase YdfG
MIILLGRDTAKLEDTQKSLSCSSVVYSISVVDEEAMTRVAVAVGSWDILILSTGYLSNPAALKDSSVAELWQSFEVGLISFNLMKCALSLSLAGD